MPRLVKVLLTFAILCSIARADEKDKPDKAPLKKKDNHPVYTDPKDAAADPDFAIQGEYAGEISGGKAKLGVQVVALGDGNFTAVIHNGGLPGDGWDGKPRITLSGKTEAAATTFSGQGYSASIANGALTGKTETGEAFELKKVERVSPDEGAKPPPDAVVLFAGISGEAFVDALMDDRHYLECGTETTKHYQDFTLHVEFLLPFKPFGRDQDRGNSGIYIQHRYEIQILDTFGHPEEFNGCGSTYRQTPPKVNMCYPPLRWQTYDIKFTAPRWDAQGMKTANARVTVRHNGIVVQDDTELPTKTGAGLKESPEPGPIQLQAHHNPVYFRNIWIIEGK